MRTVVTLAAVLAAAPALAHEVNHEVVRGNAVAVRASEDGVGVANAPFQVWSPADRRQPYVEGRTDRAGWLAFVPDVQGRWRVRVAEDDGHGFDVEIEAGPASGATPGPAGSSSVARVFRPLLGVFTIGAVFAALYLGYRRKKA